MICIPIIAQNSDEAITKIAEAASFADMVEIRLDLMESFDLKAMISASAKPVLVTYRTRGEGGGGSADYLTHIGYLKNAIELGAALVDIEYRVPLEFRRTLFLDRGRSKLVASAHLLHGTPSREHLGKLLKKMAATGADIVKIVTYATCWEDNLRVLELIPQARALGVEIIAFCMGPLGRISRVFSSLLGSYVTFASLGPGQESASGQISIREMRQLMEMFSS